MAAVKDKLIRPGDKTPWFEVTGRILDRSVEWVEVTQCCATISDGVIESTFVAPMHVLRLMGWQVHSKLTEKVE
jgi:hypothetical protein